MAEPVCPGCRELLHRVVELEAQVAELTRRLDDALRAGKRQAAPFRKGPPKPNPKKPGRRRRPVAVGAVGAAGLAPGTNALINGSRPSQARTLRNQNRKFGGLNGMNRTPLRSITSYCAHTWAGHRFGLRRPRQ